MKRGRSVARAGALVALVMSAGTALPPAGAGQPLHRASAAATASQRPATGRFHSLSAPARVLSKHTLAAHSRTTVHLGGHGGVPRSGLRAVALTMSATGSKAGAQVYAGPGAHRPASPSVVTSGQTTSSFAIVPVTSTGVMHVWTGRHSASLSLTVTGYFSGKAETGTTGLLDRLADRQVAKVRLRAAHHVRLPVAGREDVPKTGAAAVLVRVTVLGAGRSGTIGVGPTTAAAASAGSLAYAPGTTSDLAIARLKRGHLVLTNASPKAALVTLDAVAWFTDGRAATQFGDALQVTDKPRVVVASKSVGAGGRTVVTSGVGGIPAATSAAPASLVLWRSSLTAPSKTGSLSADPASASRTHIVAQRVQKSHASAGLVLAPPDATNRTSVYTDRGTVKQSAEAYAWFAGGVLIAEGAHILTGTTLASVSAVSPGQVTFAGHPAGLADLAVDDTLVAGVSGGTPVGLLRKVTAVDASGADTVVSTADASLTDVVLQGDLSVGTAAGPPRLPLAGSRSARGSARKALRAQAVIATPRLVLGMVSGSRGFVEGVR